MHFFPTRLVLALVLALGLTLPAFAAEEDYLAHLGDALPEMTFETTAGETFAFPVEGARAHVIHVFACDSEICGEALEAIERGLWKHVAEEPVALVAIARDASVAEARAIAEEKGVTFRIVADPDRKLASKLVEGGRGVPRTIVADADGRVVWRHDGFSDGREVEFRAVVEAVLNSDPIPAALAERPESRRTGGPAAAGGSFVGEKLPEVQVEKWVNEPPSDDGKYVMLEFWATWCPPCRMAMPHLEEVWKEKSDRLVIKSISSEDEATVRRFIEKEGFTYPIGVDTQGRNASEMRVMGIPHAFIADPDGVIVWEGNPLEFLNDPGLLDRVLSGVDSAGDADE